MTEPVLPVRALPVAQNWDCHGCTECCRAPASVLLSASDRDRLDEQGWARHPDYAARPIVVRRGREYWLAQRSDGRCIFLTDAAQCRIHAEHGAEAKPLACRVFPFQLTPLGSEARLSVRLWCPSAARSEGRPLAEHVAGASRLAAGVLEGYRTLAPPPIASTRRSWRETRRVTDAFERVLLDPAMPMVRRMVRALRLADLLASARLGNLDAGQLAEFVRLIERSSENEAAEFFRASRPARRWARLLFRQTAAEYLREHAGHMDRPGLGTRLRLLAAGLSFARGDGPVPAVGADWPPVNFADLEKPLGPLPESVLAPLCRFFDVTVAAMNYSGAARANWSIVDGLCALALAYAVAHWMLRWLARDHALSDADAVRIVGTIDRAHFYPLLTGRRHRLRVRLLARAGELDRLVVWYAQ